MKNQSDQTTRHSLSNSSTLEFVASSSFWKGKRVLITGHTGFKGSWLSLWLHKLGAKVYGVSLPPPTDPSIFELLKLDQTLESRILDIRDLENLKKHFLQAEPEIVFHMAAQPLVRLSYDNPLETYTTNVIGSLNVLEACRPLSSLKAIIVITTDKCYENKEWIYPYRETDPMGGFDPYSSSKGCTELLVSSYRNSFFQKHQPSPHQQSPHQSHQQSSQPQHQIGLASARAGNVIGGGDWAKDRLIPDIIQSFHNNKVLKIRNPQAIRPWQHVLSPLSGYIRLAEKLFDDPSSYSTAYNFGPTENDCLSVGDIVRKMADHWTQWISKNLSNNLSKDLSKNLSNNLQNDLSNDLSKNKCEYTFEENSKANPHEASLLKLDSSKAKSQLQWTPRWSIETALEETMKWYLAFYKENSSSLMDISLNQIEKYSKS